MERIIMEIESREAREACEVEVVQCTSKTNVCEVYMGDNRAAMAASNPKPVVAWVIAN